MNAARRLIWSLAMATAVVMLAFPPYGYPSGLISVRYVAHAPLWAPPSTSLDIAVVILLMQLSAVLLIAGVLHIALGKKQ